MIQRFIKTALDAGITAIENDLDIIDDIFAPFDLETTEIEGIRTWFTNDKPTVHHGYARNDTNFPSFHIILANEGEDQHFMGDDAGMVQEGADFGADIISTIWSHTYPILCYAEHPDVTTYMYEIAKSIIMVNAGEFFADQGIFNLDLSGMDLAPDPRYLPEHLFARQLVFKCNREFCRVDRDSLAGKAFKVAGIHIDKSGSPRDVGGVKTLVTPYAVSQVQEDDDGA